MPEGHKSPCREGEAAPSAGPRPGWPEPGQEARETQSDQRAARTICSLQTVLACESALAASACRVQYDFSDHMLDPHLFRALAEAVGPFEIDAACDPLGKNKHCPSFWSVEQDSTKQDWSERSVWCNGPFDAAGAFR